MPSPASRDSCCMLPSALPNWIPSALVCRASSLSWLTTKGTLPFPQTWRAIRAISSFALSSMLRNLHSTASTPPRIACSHTVAGSRGAQASWSSTSHSRLLRGQSGFSSVLNTESAQVDHGWLVADVLTEVGIVQSQHVVDVEYPLRQWDDETVLALVGVHHHLYARHEG